MLKMTLNNLQLFAHKKGGGSTSNGRDSQAKRLGAKAADGQTVTGGSILYRQRGTHIYPGVTILQRSGNKPISRLPIVTIGSIAIHIPALSNTPLPRLP